MEQPMIIIIKTNTDQIILGFMCKKNHTSVKT